VKAIITLGDGSVSLAHVPPPDIGPYDSLVKIHSCLFCNTTDRHIIDRSFDFGLVYPCVLGHESIGEIVTIGKRVRNFDLGDRVTRPYSVYPDETLGGLGSGWGGFAEYGKIRDIHAMIEDGESSETTIPNFFRCMQKIPKSVPLDEAAMITPLREIYSSAAKIPNVEGRSILIAGAGIAGVLFAKFLHLRGAGAIAIAARRQTACAFALSETPATEAKPLEEFCGHRFDIAIDTTGSTEIAKSIVENCLAPKTATYTYAIYPPSEEDDFLHGITRIDPQEADAHDAICALLSSGQLKTAHWITKKFQPDEAVAAWQSVLAKESLKTSIVFAP